VGHQSHAGGYNSKKSTVYLKQFLDVTRGASIPCGRLQFDRANNEELQIFNGVGTRAPWKFQMVRAPRWALAGTSKGVCLCRWTILFLTTFDPVVGCYGD